MESTTYRLLTPGTSKYDALRGIGITGKQQTLGFNIHLEEDEITQLAKLLHTLNHACSKDKLEDIVTYKRSFKSTNLRLRGKAEWDDNIPIIHHTNIQKIRAPTMTPKI